MRQSRWQRGRELARAMGVSLSVVVLAGVTGSVSTASASGPCTTAPVSGGQWPMYGHDVANTRTQPEQSGLTPSGVANLAPAWTFSTSSTGDGTGFNSTPVVSDGCVFIASFGGTAYALNARTGKVVWQRILEAPNPGSGGADVGAAAIYGREVIYLVDEFTAPYAIAFNKSSGALIWRSAPFAPPLSSSVAQAGSYANSSPIVANGFVLAGWSPPEGDPTASGGFALINAKTGEVVKETPTIPQSAQEEGFAGGGLWSTPAYDPKTKFAYWGAGNPSSKEKQFKTTDAILKIDVNPRRPTFGKIVASYEGNVDQYTQTLEELSHSPACEASNKEELPYPLDDPACGQLDLDFGAAANLFTTASGTSVVGDLQKAGVYHVADTKGMTPVWSAIIGPSCFACNADSTAFDGKSIYAVSTPGGTMFSLERSSGAVNWASPVADGLHYQSVSTSQGVVWTVDGDSNLDGFEASSGTPLVRRPLSVDAGAPVANLTSSGVAIAEGQLFVAAGGASYEPATGYVIAYGG
jgi:polyvinyl alcohol dehydrogenase (cytochrome)